MILLLCVQIAIVLLCLASVCVYYSFSPDKELEKLDKMIAESYAMAEHANKLVESSK